MTSTDEIVFISEQYKEQPLLWEGNGGICKGTRLPGTLFGVWGEGLGMRKLLQPRGGVLGGSAVFPSRDYLPKVKANYLVRWAVSMDIPFWADYNN